MERVCSEFFPHEARTILGIPLSSRQSTNTLIWAGTKLGHYSTKSAYKLLSEAPCSGTSNPSAHNSFWRNIWLLAVPNKIKHFIWPACWDRCLQKRTYSQGRSPETALVTFARRKWRHHPCITGLSETILWIGLWIFEIYGLGLQVQTNTSWQRDLLSWVGVFGKPETLQDSRNHAYHFQASTATPWNGFGNFTKLDIKDNPRHQWFWTSDHR